MSRYKPHLLITVIGATLVLPGSLTAQIGEVFPVWPAEGTQEAPAIHGNYIVWHEFMPEQGDYDIVVTDINAPQGIESVVLREAGDQMNPDVWEETVVWQSLMSEPDQSMHWDVWAAKWPLSHAPVYFNVSRVLGNNEQMPQISGNTVVWEDGPLDGTSIYGADITDVNYPQEFAIAAYDSVQRAPAIDRLHVVWQDDEPGDWDIYASDVWLRNDPREFSVTPYEKPQTAPIISGKTIVWQARDAGNWDIHAARIEPQCLRHLPAITEDPADQVNPAMHGQIVVWQDGRNGDWDIYAAHIKTGQEFRITRHPANQVRPKVFGHVIVWQDDRSGTWQVYAMVLNDGPLTQGRDGCSDDLIDG